jgi:hypothetical protein
VDAEALAPHQFFAETGTPAMQYLNPTFTVGPAATTAGVLCEACVFKHGEHSAECREMLKPQQAADKPESVH